MGHFGRRPITLVWYCLVLPALLLNYFGQAALVLDTNEVGALFYRMAPDWGVTPLAVLATMASAIASQALIAGAFSLTVMAVQLDYLPRVAIRHTSGEHQGQVYVPLVNWALMIGCLGLVLGFRNSSNLAAAYGIAVTTTMLITATIFFQVARQKWGWPLAKALLVVVPLFLIDLAFLAANIPKIPSGAGSRSRSPPGSSSRWPRGARAASSSPLGSIAASARSPRCSTRRATSSGSPGTAVFMFKDLGKAPPALVNNLRHNKVLHKTTLIVSIETAEVPARARRERPRSPRSSRACTRCCSGSASWRSRTSRRRSRDPRPWSRLRPDDVTYFIGGSRSSPARRPG
jgi:KUP system potassium uptake protein